MADSQAYTIAASGEQDLFEVLGAKNMSEDEKAVLLARLFELVQVNVMEKVYAQLNEEEREQFMQLLEKAPIDDVNDYLDSHIPNLEQMYEDEGRLVRQKLILKLAA